MTEYICPKCGSKKWKVGRIYDADTNPDKRICASCDYEGIFLIKEKLNKKQKSK